MSNTRRSPPAKVNSTRQSSSGTTAVTALYIACSPQPVTEGVDLESSSPWRRQLQSASRSLVQLGPRRHQLGLPRRQFPLKDFAGFDGHQRSVVLIVGVEVGGLCSNRRTIHADHNP